MPSQEPSVDRTFLPIHPSWDAWRNASETVNFSQEDLELWGPRNGPNTRFRSGRKAHARRANTVAQFCTSLSFLNPTNSALPDSQNGRAPLADSVQQPREATAASQKASPVSAVGEETRIRAEQLARTLEEQRRQRLEEAAADERRRRAAAEARVVEEARQKERPARVGPAASPPVFTQPVGSPAWAPAPGSSSTVPSAVPANRPTSSLEPSPQQYSSPVHGISVAHSPHAALLTPPAPSAAGTNIAL